MLKQVDLPAPFGPISARNSPSRDIEADVVYCMYPAECLGEIAHAQNAHASLPLRTNRLASAPTMPPGNASTRREDYEAKEPAPERRLAHDRVLQPRKDSCAHDRAAQRLDAAEQHHDHAVERARDPGEIGRDRAFGEREQRSGRAAERSRDGKADPMHALDVDADRLRPQGESRPARIA